MDEQKDKDIVDDLEKEEREQLHRVVLAFSQQSFEIKRLLTTALIAIATVCGAVFRGSYHLLLEYREIICIGALVIICAFWIMDGMTNFYINRLRAQIDELRNRARERNGLPRNNVYWNIEDIEVSGCRKLLSFMKISKVYKSSFFFYYILSFKVLLVIVIPFEAIF